ncbi:MAG TPA: anti-sigma factor [Gammaproteobacteria bacterium]|nr:anti-sigma factor [Gammaproteobacteria bacterium]
MSEHPRHDFSERLIDLSADYAVGQCEPNDMAELQQLDPNESARAAFEAVAAEIDAAYADYDPVEIPSGLEEKLFAAIPSAQPEQAKPELKLTNAPEPVMSAPSLSGAGTWFPWLVAAASVAITGAVLLRPQATQTAPTAAEQRDQLIAQADPDSLLRYTWTATEDPSVVAPVTGELIWDEATDQGYMTISGLEVNDPSEFQYQLWIFDATRPLGELPQFAGPFNDLLTQRPIDGGVFDITDAGEVVIPIDAKLMVQQGVAFAVTVERPGGVVVSDRSRVPLLAIPG